MEGNEGDRRVGFGKSESIAGRSVPVEGLYRHASGDSRQQWLTAEKAKQF